MKKWLVNLLVFNFVFSLGTTSVVAKDKEEAGVGAVHSEDGLKQKDKYKIINNNAYVSPFANCEKKLRYDQFKTLREFKGCVAKVTDTENAYPAFMDTRDIKAGKNLNAKKMTSDSYELESVEIRFSEKGNLNASDDYNDETLYSKSFLKDKHSYKCFQYKFRRRSNKSSVRTESSCFALIKDAKGNTIPKTEGETEVDDVVASNKPSFMGCQSFEYASLNETTTHKNDTEKKQKSSKKFLRFFQDLNIHKDKIKVKSNKEIYACSECKGDYEGIMVKEDYKLRDFILFDSKSPNLLNNEEIKTTYADKWGAMLNQDYKGVFAYDKTDGSLSVNKCIKKGSAVEDKSKKEEKKTEETQTQEQLEKSTNSSAKSAGVDQKVKSETIITTTSLAPANSESFKNAYDAAIKNLVDKKTEAKAGQTTTTTSTTTEESRFIVLPTSFTSPSVASSAASSSCMQLACLQSLLAASQSGTGLSAGLGAVQSQPSSGSSIESILAQLNKAQGGVVAQPAAPSLQLPDYLKLLTSQGMALSGRLQIISTNPIILLDSSHEQLKPEDIIKDKKDDNFEKIAQGIYDGCLEDKYDYLGVQPLCFKDAGALDEVEGIAVLKELFKQNSCIELEKKDDKGISQLQAVYADCKKEYAKNGKYFNFDLNKDVSLVAHSKITVQSADVYKNGIKTSCEKAGEKEEITKVIVIETEGKKTEDLLKDINARDLKKATKIELIDSLNGGFKNDSFKGENSVSVDNKIRITVKEDKAAIKDGIELNCASILKGRGVATIVTGATVTEKGLRKTKVLNQECFNKKVIASELSSDQKVELLKISIK